MTKAELVADLKSKSFVSGILGTPILIESKPDGGDKWYQINIREVVGNVCIYRNVDFYVIDEGKVGESAYYKDKTPIQIVEDDVTVKFLKDISDAELNKRATDLGLTKKP